MSLPDMTEEPGPAPSYSRLVIRWTLVATTAELAYLVGLVFVGQWLARALPGLGPEPFGLTFIFVAACLYAAILGPIRFHCFYRLRRQGGLAAGTAAQGWKGVFRAILVRVTIPGMLALVLLMGLGGPFWNALALSAWLILFLVASLGRTPRRVLGYRLAPAGDQPQLQELRKTLDDWGFPQVQIRLLQAAQIGKEAAAACWGWRKKPILCLSDTILGLLDQQELAAIGAHELGHYRHRHSVQAVLTWASAWAAAFFAASYAFDLQAAAHVAGRAILALPVALMAGWLVLFLLSPLLLAFSRRRERQANEWGFRQTGDPGPFLRAIRKLGRNNLVDGEPNWLDKALFQSHPSLREIERQAEEFTARRGGAASD